MEAQKIKIEGDYKLPSLIRDVSKGILRIPNFQRNFIWEKSKVIKLLESIYLEFPIGTFFFWDAPRKYYGFYRDIAELDLPSPSRYDKITFILDGQQRITSLYVTFKGLELYGRDYKKICFDLDSLKRTGDEKEKKHFVDRNPDGKRFISISAILSEEIFNEVFDSLSPERKKALLECRNRFTSYPFSVVYVREKDLDEACEIFERLNQGGRRLNLFDLISAGTWSTDFDLRKAIDLENDKYQNKGFGKLDNEVYTQTLALIAKNSCTRVSQLQLRKGDIKDHWKDAVMSIELAADYLHNNLGVVNYQFVPYRGMIGMIAYLFYKNRLKGLSRRQKELVDSWFWQASFAERYTASTLTLMTEDAKFFNKIAKDKETKVNFQHSLDIESLMKIRMYRKSAVKNGILCLLATKRPRHFKNNGHLSLGEEYFSDFNSSEKHHIFPRSVIEKKFGLAAIHALPNFCFLPAELNKEISNKKPSNYFENYKKENPDFEDTLRTHLIKYDESIKRNEFTSFLGARAAIILEEIERLTGSKASRVTGDSASKALKITEKKIRDFLDLKLSKKDPNYWKKKIPSDIVAQARRKAIDYIKKDPSKELKNLSSREMMDFCDLMNYPKIILSNWDIFYSAFRSKFELEKRFINLKEFRNAIVHNREIMPFMEKEGEAALEWLDMILSTDVAKQETKEKPKAGQKKKLAKRHVFRKKFWKQLLKKAKTKTDLHANISPGIYNWVGTGAGKSGLSFNYSISKKEGVCELYIDRGKGSQKQNKKWFDKLFKNKKKIEKAFGDKLNWERLDDKRASRIARRYKGVGLYDEEKWVGLQRKMIDGMIRLEKALKGYIKDL